MTREQSSQGKILIDSNLLILLCVGLADIGYVRRHKRLRAYDEKDFEILSNYVDKASTIMISPNTATEFSNLSRQIQTPMKEHITLVFRDLLRTLIEVYVESKNVTERKEFVRLGLTDAGLLQILEENPQATLLTVDNDLFLAAAYSRLKATNFHHLRDQRSDFQ